MKQIGPTGSIVLTDGVRAYRPQKGAALATAFGGAIEHLAWALAVDLAPLSVNAVCPGLVLTERPSRCRIKLRDRCTRGQPLARGAEPEEVAQAYLYAMRAGYTAGQVLAVDDGRLHV